MDAVGLIGKKVVVRQKDKWKKWGFLKSVTEKYLVLKYTNGEEEIISLDEIVSVKEDKKR
ncbi:MAG: hypothetical protein ACP5HJ_03490 [Candidatus Micrarchaeia archaeon]|jgi:hypothetical protein